MGTSNETVETNGLACTRATQENNDTHQHGGDSEAPDLTKVHVVAFTSRLIAAARALESRRPDRLFNDCFAELLAGDEGIRAYDEHARLLRASYEFGPRSAENENDESSKAGGSIITPNQPADNIGTPSTGGESASRHLAIRTRYGDDFFEDCTLPPRDIKQIVSLGAGLDTRGYRLRAGPGTTVFEVDQALVLAFKKDIISGSTSQSMGSDQKLDGVGDPRVIGVEADLRQTGWEGKLTEAGYDPAMPSAWILEGLTMYLEEHEVVKLVQIMANLSSPGSAFCIGFISEEWIELAKRSDDDIFRTWKWGSDDPQAFLEGCLPGKWSLKCVMIGTPGEFPDGANYSLGYKGKGASNVIGYAA